MYVFRYQPYIFHSAYAIAGALRPHKERKRMRRFLYAEKNPIVSNEHAEH
jgi:hypothetical protein